MFIIKKNKYNLGATLIELIISIVIISIAIVALISFLNLFVSKSVDPMTRKQAVIIAESLMDEISNQQFIKPSGGYTGPYNSINRNKFDSVMDYNGLLIVGMTTFEGVTIPSLSNYSINISITNVNMNLISASDCYQINITVTSPNDNFTLQGYRINYE